MPISERNMVLPGLKGESENERRDSTQRVLEAAMDVAQPLRQHGVYPGQTEEMLRAQDI